MKTNYEELIEQLRRSGKMYYPSNQSDLYFRAANAIEELLSKITKQPLKRRLLNVIRLSGKDPGCGRS